MTISAEAEIPLLFAYCAGTALFSFGVGLRAKSNRTAFSLCFLFTYLLPGIGLLLCGLIGSDVAPADVLKGMGYGSVLILFFMFPWWIGFTVPGFFFGKAAKAVFAKPEDL